MSQCTSGTIIIINKVNLKKRIRQKIMQVGKHMIQQFHFWELLKGNEISMPNEICTLVFIAVLFPIAKIWNQWNQSRCPSTNEQIKKTGYFNKWNILFSL
jgi:hypothetical protein